MRCYAVGIICMKITFILFYCIMLGKLPEEQSTKLDPNTLCLSLPSVKCLCSHLQGMLMRQIHNVYGLVAVKWHPSRNFQVPINDFIFNERLGCGSAQTFPWEKVQGKVQYNFSHHLFCMLYEPTVWCCGHVTVCTLSYTVEYLISQCLFTEQLNEMWTIFFLSLVKYGMHGFSKFEFLLRQILSSQPNCGKLLSAFLRIGCWSIYCLVRADVLDKDLFSRDLSFLLIIKH